MSTSASPPPSPSKSSTSSQETVTASYPDVYDSEKGQKRLANYLRSANGVKVRGAVEHGKRVEYFKGKRLIETLLNPDPKKWPKDLPKIEDKTVANSIASLLLKNSYFHRSEKSDEKKGVLTISKKKVFEDDGYYTWIFSGSMLWSHIFTGVMMGLVIFFTLMPLWPHIMKKILWYCAVTFLLIFSTFSLIRLLLYLVCWVLGYEFWILPRFFDETLGVLESFQPIYSFEPSSEGQGYYRTGLLIAFVAFVFWCMSQPTDFDAFVEGQKTFVDDLYSGNLLTDFSQASKDRMDSLTKSRVPDLDALLRQVEMDELAETAHQEEGEQRTDFSQDTFSDANRETAAEIDADGEHDNFEDSILDELLNEADEDEEDKEDEVEEV